MAALASQPHHQRKRQATAAAALEKLAKLLVGCDQGADRERLVRSDTPSPFNKLLRCLAVAEDVEDNEAALRRALYSLALLATPTAASAGAGAGAGATARKEEISCNRALWDTAGLLAVRLAAVGARSIIGNRMGVRAPSDHASAYALERLGLSPRLLQSPPPLDDDDERAVAAAVAATVEAESSDTDGAVEAVNERSRGGSVPPLPFRVICGGAAGVAPTLAELEAEVPFVTESLVTRGGARVAERRDTCWMADERGRVRLRQDHGARAHGRPPSASGTRSVETSGTTSTVAKLRPTGTGTETEMETENSWNHLLQPAAKWAASAVRLRPLNFYGDGDSACKLHNDPETNGANALWATDSVIVSIGETRRFSFKEIAPLQQEVGQMRAGGEGMENVEPLATSWTAISSTCSGTARAPTSTACGKPTRPTAARERASFQTSLPGVGKRDTDAQDSQRQKQQQQQQQQKKVPVPAH